MALCVALMDGEPEGRRPYFAWHSRTRSTTGTISGGLTSPVSPRSPGEGFGSVSSPVEPKARSNGLGKLVRRSITILDIQGVCVEAVWDWRSCVERLLNAHKTLLKETYKRYEHFATPDFLEALFTNRNSGSPAVGIWVKNFGAYKRMQGQIGVATTWETRFQHYDQLAEDLADLTSLLQSGVSLDRAIREADIAPRGDIVLEFPNTAMLWKPILRFRVSSHMLVAASPIFARMFGRLNETDFEEDSLPDAEELPPAPTPFVCADSSRVMLYRMPQLELDEESAMKIVLHAVHMHKDRVPRDISFSQFVAVAEAAMRYRCTAPLELVVEHRWLEQWMHKASEPMPDGLVVISYAFGLRRLFTRTTKSAIFNVRSEEELRVKKWPKEIKDKVWAVQSAKMAQVHSTCVQAIEEYLRPSNADVHAGRDMEDDLAPESTEGDTDSAYSVLHKALLSDGRISPDPLPHHPLFLPIGTPRCPKGDHLCDATNVGWLMLLYHQLQLLPAMLDADAFANTTPASPVPERLLQEVLDALRTLASPPKPGHGGICDPIMALRSAVNDVYNSVTGLTLFEIDGKRHGWALSRHRRHEPQKILRLSSGTIPGTLTIPETFRVTTQEESPETGHKIKERWGSAAKRVAAQAAFAQEDICFGVLRNLETFDDLHAVAKSNRTMYETYKTHELHLMKRIIRADRKNTIQSMLIQESGDGYTTPARSPIPKNVVQKPLNVTRKAVNIQQHDGVFNSSETGSNASTVDTDDEATIMTERTMSRDTETFVDSETELASAPPYTPASEAGEASEGHFLLQMTEEEARRIIWPEPDKREPNPTTAGPARDGVITPHGYVGMSTSEIWDDSKVLFKEAVRVEKTLAVMGNKQLRQDFDQRVGLGPA